MHDYARLSKLFSKLFYSGKKQPGNLTKNQYFHVWKLDICKDIYGSHKTAMYTNDLI